MKKTLLLAGVASLFAMNANAVEFNPYVSAKLRYTDMSSDITLADFWSVAGAVPHMNDDRGVSAVIVNTAKGQELINELDQAIEVKYEDAVRSNGGFFSTFEIPAARDEFFQGLDAASDLNTYIRRFVKTKSCIREAYERLHTILASIKRRILS